MKTKKMLAVLVLALVLMVCPARVSKAVEMGTAFTYQGRLIDASEPADGLYDFQFKLYGDPCVDPLIAGPVNEPDLDVIDGYFTALLDFNDPCAFNGEARWLEIGIRPGPQSDPCAYNILLPRQEITPTPYAIYAMQSSGLTLPYLGAAFSAESAFLVRNYGSGKAIQGIGENNDGLAGGSYAAGRSGVFGYNDDADGFGVFGSSTNGIGVKGYTYGTTGTAGRFEIQNVNNNNAALVAITNGGGSAVSAWSTASAGSTYGVQSICSSSQGKAVFGINNGNGNYGYLGGSSSGVTGYSEPGYGVYGESINSYGGYFKATGSQGRAVYAEATYPGEETNEITYGGYFKSASRYGAGVYGLTTHSYGGKGVYGYASGDAGIGVYGQTSGNINAGVLGTCINESAGRGVVGTSAADTGIGVMGWAYDDGDYENYGGYFEAYGTYGRGVYANAAGSDGVGIYGEATGGGKAGHFEGDVHVTGQLTKAYTAGTSNLATPIAYAFIKSDGTKASGTPNVSCTWNAGSQMYEITISGENYYYSNYVTVVTLSGTTGVAKTGSVSNKLLIYIYNLAGTLTQSDFQFVTYKP